MKIIYVGGYGRSGSTYLDLLLGQHSEIASGGELANFPKLMADGNIMCSCGSSYSDCSVWNPVLNHLEEFKPVGLNWQKIYRESLIKDLLGVNRFSNIVSTFFKCISTNENWQYNKELFESLSKSQNVKFIVDSSKNSYLQLFRPLSLAKQIDSPLFFIHLVRNPFSVAASLKKGTNKSLEKGGRSQRRFAVLRAYFGWMISNLAALINTKFIGDDKSIVIKYEDLLSDPKREIKKISMMLGVSPDNILDFVDGDRPQSESHLCEGNRMAKKPLSVGVSSNKVEPTLREKLYYFFLCSWLDRIITKMAAK